MLLSSYVLSNLLLSPAIVKLLCVRAGPKSGQAFAWDHPSMPWDGTELFLAGFDATGEMPRLRDEQRFSDVDALIEQMQKDAVAGRGVLGVP